MAGVVPPSSVFSVHIYNFVFSVYYILYSFNRSASFASCLYSSKNFNVFQPRCLTKRKQTSPQDGSSSPGNGELVNGKLTHFFQNSLMITDFNPPSTSTVFYLVINKLVYLWIQQKLYSWPAIRQTLIFLENILAVQAEVYKFLVFATALIIPDLLKWALVYSPERRFFLHYAALLYTLYRGPRSIDQGVILYTVQFILFLIETNKSQKLSFLNHPRKH